MTREEGEAEGVRVGDRKDTGEKEKGGRRNLRLDSTVCKQADTRDIKSFVIYFRDNAGDIHFRKSQSLRGCPGDRC